MSSKTIKNILSALGIIDAIALAIYGAILGSGMARSSDDEFGYGFLGFIIGCVVGFGIIIVCFAIGNALFDLERTADATEELCVLLRKNNSNSNDNGNSSSERRRPLSERLNSGNNDHYVSDSWTCKKCGRVNLKADMTCKDCGAYK